MQINILNTTVKKKGNNFIVMLNSNQVQKTKHNTRRAQRGSKEWVRGGIFMHWPQNHLPCSSLPNFDIFSICRKNRSRPFEELPGEALGVVKLLRVSASGRLLEPIIGIGLLLGLGGGAGLGKCRR